MQVSSFRVCLPACGALAWVTTSLSPAPLAPPIRCASVCTLTPAPVPGGTAASANTSRCATASRMSRATVSRQRRRGHHSIPQPTRTERRHAVLKKKNTTYASTAPICIYILQWWTTVLPVRKIQECGARAQRVTRPHFVRVSRGAGEVGEVTRRPAVHHSSVVAGGNGITFRPRGRGRSGRHSIPRFSVCEFHLYIHA